MMLETVNKMLKNGADLIEAKRVRNAEAYRVLQKVERHPWDSKKIAAESKIRFAEEYIEKLPHEVEGQEYTSILGAIQDEDWNKLEGAYHSPNPDGMKGDIVW